jgi:hypothetical protein
MAKIAAGITTSVDGYIMGPSDGPGKELGDGGEDPAARRDPESEGPVEAVRRRPTGQGRQHHQPLAARPRTAIGGSR